MRWYWVLTLIVASYTLGLLTSSLLAITAWARALDEQRWP